MAAIASSSSSVLRYDVFLSFRGEDTRKTFTSHLYAALRRKKLEAYIDEENLERGEEISSTLLTTIEESKLSIVVFSENYASSRWCLNELVRIMECKEEREHIVLPVFYEIDPSDVRNQKGSYADAFLKHEGRYKNDTTNKLQDWRKALTAAADLSGFDSRKLESESNLVGKIVEEVLKKLSSISNSTNDQFIGLVGMDKHLQKMESLLCLGSQDVRVIGIWGMGGIGKTTLADVVYKRFYSRFEGGCFFENVNEIGLRQLEEKLFSELLEDKMNLDYRHSSLANDRLRRKKVLVVLDNVTDLKQLECLLGCSVKKERDRFGAGSRIILTSRDIKLLRPERAIYQVQALGCHEALDLFYWKAFGSRDSPGTNFVELSRRVVEYAQGNPLALTVLGSHLHHRTIREWESTLIALENAPNQDINQVLKMSYDVLDDRKKSTFLDIACFLKGENRDSIEEILGIGSHIEISVLIEKSLITINRANELSIHDLLLQMAREIVNEESKEVGRRSRLFNAKDICRVLKNNKGTATIEGIFLDLSDIIPEDLCLKSTVFEDMCNLRILKVHFSLYPDFNASTNYINIPQGLGYLPDSLRYLVWEYCPLQYLPSNFEPQNLVILKMECSKLKELWNGITHLPNLKVLNLRGSEELIKLPDLSNAPKLETLELKNCKSLRQLSDIPVNINYLDLSSSGIEALPSSFGSLKNIVQLDLSFCESLESLPSNIGKLKFLKKLNLSYCSRLKILPEISEDMEHLEDLDLSGTGIEELPSSIQNLIGLRRLALRGCKNLKFLPEFLFSLGHLSCLNLEGCSKLGRFPPMLLRCSNIYLGYCNISEIPDGLDSLSALREIDLSGNNFERIPESIVRLDLLSYLNISHCKNLRHLPELPASTDVVRANDCTSLVTVDTLTGLPSGIPYGDCDYVFFNCWEMEQSARDNILIYFLSRVFHMATTTKDFSDWDTYMMTSNACYPGNEIPKWFSNQREGSTTTIKIPPNWFNNSIKGFAACVAVEFDESLEPPFDLYFETSHGDFSGRLDIGIFFQNEEGAIISSDHVFMWYFYNPDIKFALQNLGSEEESFDFTITCNNYEFVKVKRCGIRIICCSPEAEEECPIFQEDPDSDMMSIPGSDDGFNMELPISQEDPDSDVMSIPGSDDSSNMELQSLGNNPNSEYFTTAEAEEECRISHSDYIIAEGICQDLTLSIGSHSDKMSIPGYHDCFNMELQRLGNNPNSGDSTTAERLCLDLSLSSGSQSNKIIPGHSDCSKMDLQRLGSNPNYSEYSTTAEGVCLDLSLSIGSYSYEIISGHHDCSSNLNSEGNNGCLISQLLEEPCETETINFDAKESCMHKTKCFDFRGCLSFLSLITEWKARKEN